MRDPNRLDTFYATMRNIHQKSFPDLYSQKNIDPFFPEEDKMLEYFKEFAEGNK